MEEIINTCEYYKICERDCGGTLEDTEFCSCYKLYKQLKRLEKENAELKALCDTYRTCYQARHDDIKERIFKYKSILEEIRGICKSSKESSCDDCPICDDCEELCINDDNLQDIIIDKINEVLND